LLDDPCAEQTAAEQQHQPAGRAHDDRQSNASSATPPADRVDQPRTNQHGEQELEQDVLQGEPPLQSRLSRLRALTGNAGEDDDDSPAGGVGSGLFALVTAGRGRL